MSVSGALLVGGAAQLNGTVTVTGDTQLNSTLAVTGAAHLQSTVSVNGVLTLNDNLDMQDGDKILLGTGDDLEIYHDGSNSYAKDGGTGLLVMLSNLFRVNNAANSEVMLDVVEDGAVSLYYNGGTKLFTTAGGVEVTGNVTSST